MAVIGINLPRQRRKFWKRGYNRDKPAAPAAKFLEKDIDEGGFLRVLHSNFAPPPQSACTQIFAPPPLIPPPLPVPINNDRSLNFTGATPPGKHTSMLVSRLVSYIIQYITRPSNFQTLSFSILELGCSRSDREQYRFTGSHRLYQIESATKSADTMEVCLWRIRGSHSCMG